MMEDQDMKKETEYEKTQGMESSEIEKLTDDCLIEIFQRLPKIADKIRIERVCKRWQYLSQKSWNNFKSLDLSANTWGLEEYPLYRELITTLDFDKIIRLSGKYLTSISTDVGNFVRICHLLPKIRKLQLMDYCVNKDETCDSIEIIEFPNQRNYWGTTSQCTYDTWQVILSWLMSRGENITHFKMQVHHNHHKEWDFARLLGNLKQLKSFSLYNCDYLNWSGIFLLELPFETIQKIILTSYDTLPFDIDVMSTMIQKCEKLQTLGIKVETFEEPEILELLSLHSASLKNLQVNLGGVWNRQWKSVLLSTSATLTHLEKLDLGRSTYITDEVLEGIAKTCKKLTYLDLTGCWEVTDRGISSICHLKKLTYLSISKLLGIRNPPLEKLTSLVVLDSFGNKKMQEECLCTFLKKALQLRALDVRFVDSVTNKLFTVAIEVAQTRNSHNPLDLSFSKYKKDTSVLEKKPSFLNIIDFGSERMPVAKYGIKDPFNMEIPQVHMS